MNIVTGAAGFIGSHLVDLMDKNTIYCDNRSASMWKSHEILKVISTCRTKSVFHLGALSSTTETNTELITENNMLLSCKILEKCIELDIPLIYASSASVYGLNSSENGKFSEDNIMSPLNYYSISKSYFDNIVMQKISDNPSAKIVGLRYFNVYGKGEDHKGEMASPIHKFLKQSNETGNIKIFKGSESYLRDFIHVSDVADITFAASSFPSGIYNVGTGIPRSFLDIANIISRITGSKIIEIPFPDHLRGKYQTWTCSDNTKINSVYSSQRILLEDGINDVLGI